MKTGIKRLGELLIERVRKTINAIINITEETSVAVACTQAQALLNQVQMQLIRDVISGKVGAAWMGILLNEYKE